MFVLIGLLCLFVIRFLLLFRFMFVACFVCFDPVICFVTLRVVVVLVSYFWFVGLLFGCLCLFGVCLCVIWWFDWCLDY